MGLNLAYPLPLRLHPCIVVEIAAMVVVVVVIFICRLRHIEICFRYAVSVTHRHSFSTFASLFFIRLDCIYHSKVIVNSLGN